MQLNPYLFFFLKDGEVIAWDYKNHQQYALEKEYFDRLRLWSQDTAPDSSPIDQELADGDLLSRSPIATKKWGWDLLSQIYHIGTCNIAEELVGLEQKQWIEKYLDYCKNISQELPTQYPEREGKQVKLPNPNLSLFDNKNFLDIIKQRKTCRHFHGKPISLEILSTLLFTSLGQLHGEWVDLIENDLMTLGTRKAFPSGGGLHPEEAYVLALHVEGLEAGVYHYNQTEHSLTLIKQGNFEDRLIELLYGQYFARGLSFGIFLTARFDKSWWKYPHSRGYRVVLLDIGHASQTVLLTATALGLNTWLTGAFSDSQVEDFLEITTPCESSLFFLGGGYGDNKSVDPMMLEMASK